jgi:hypothetical protein
VLSLLSGVSPKNGIRCRSKRKRFLSQAHALQAIFTNLSRRAANQQYLKQFETYLRLSLKAQSQCVRTLEVLAAMKNPQPVAFVKQANIAHNQQVNNGIPEAAPTKQSGESDETGGNPAVSGSETLHLTSPERRENENKQNEVLNQRVGVAP